MGKPLRGENLMPLVLPVKTKVSRHHLVTTVVATTGETTAPKPLAAMVVVVEVVRQVRKVKVRVRVKALLVVVMELLVSTPAKQSVLTIRLNGIREMAV